MNLLPLLALVAAPAFAQGPGAVVTYIAGQAAINGRPVTSQAARQSTVGVGQMLSTGTGSAELALTPGVMLRMDKASSIKLVALDDKRAEVQVNSGRAEISVAGMRQGNELQVDSPNGVQTLLVQNGLYEFDARSSQLRVFDGKAAVSPSGAANTWTDVKAGHELALTSAPGKPAEFDRNAGDGFAARSDEETARGGGYGYGGPAYGYGSAYALGDYGYAPFAYAPYGYGFYDPFAFGFYPGFYGGYGFYGGFGYRGGFGYGGRGFGRR
jgi:hypothetical protein